MTNPLKKRSLQRLWDKLSSQLSDCFFFCNFDMKGFCRIWKKVKCLLGTDWFTTTAERFSPQHKGQNETNYHDLGDNI
jgi:hypothetical protein